MLSERIERSARARGFECTVGGVELGFGRLVLREIEAKEESSAVRVEVGQISADAGLWDLLVDGVGAVRHVRLRNVHVAVNLDAPGLPALLEKIRSPSGDGGAGATRGDVGRSIRVDGIAFELADREGVLVRLHEGRVIQDGDGRIRIVVGPVELAPHEDDGARVQRVVADLSRGAADWQLSAVEVRNVVLQYRDREGENSESPIWTRVRRHTRTLTEVFGMDESDDDEGATASTDAEGPALWGGARRLAESYFAREAKVRLDGLSVMSVTESGSRRVLRHLEAEAHALDGGKVRLTGAGRPGRGGRIGWNLVVSPSELRAEGRLDLQRVPFVLITPFLPALPWHQPDETRLSGELSIEGRGATRVHMEGRLSIENLGLSSPRIAPQPVRRISMELAGQADWDPSIRRLELESASVGLGQARVALSGSLEWPEEHFLIDLRATLPPTDCDSAIGAIPADLLAELGAFTFSGRIGGQIEARIDSRDLDSSSLGIRLANGCRFETAPALADVRRFEGPFRHRVVEPEGPPFEMETGPGTANWVGIQEISPFFIHAVLGHEDAGFFRHRGFSTGSIERALVRNLRAGRYVYGASTITMQLVKNVFLHREKTLARKVQEVLLTWWVESVMSKERILELYLNVIEYGPAIYGIRQAAEHYFGVTPAELGPAESAYLASILPNPKAYHSHWVGGSVPERFQRRVARFIRTLGARDRYDAEAVAYGLERLQSLRFHRPGQPAPVHEHRGRTAPLPFGPFLDAQWEEAVEDEEAGTVEDEEF